MAGKSDPDVAADFVTKSGKCVWVFFLGPPTVELIQTLAEFTALGHDDWVVWLL